MTSQDPDAKGTTVPPLGGFPGLPDGPLCVQDAGQVWSEPAATGLF